MLSLILSYIAKFKGLVLCNEFFVNLNWRCFTVFINKHGLTTLYLPLVQVSQRLPQALFLTQFYFDDLELPLFQHAPVVLTRI